jgi:hypothetical protein
MVKHALFIIGTNEKMMPQPSTNRGISPENILNKNK